MWLSDLHAWVRGIAGILKPGGRFILVEFHPFAMTYNYDWTRTDPYFSDGAAASSPHGVGDYVAMAREALAPSGYLEGVKDFVNPHRGHEFNWGLGEVVTALLDAGLILTTLREYPYMNDASLFGRMRELPGKRMVPPEDVPNLPLMFGVMARRG
jgi:hypothetical protein